MLARQSKALLPIMLTALFIASPLQAKDVATEQYNATAAQKEYDEAKSNYDAATKLVKEQEAQVTQEQLRLKELQKKQSASKADLAKTKTQLDQQQKALNRAWNESGK